MNPSDGKSPEQGATPPTSPITKKAESTQVKSVAKAMQLLSLVVKADTAQTGKALSMNTDIATPTAHHILSTLVAEGYLAKDRDARYYPGPMIDVIADFHSNAIAPPPYLRAMLDELALLVPESVYLAAWRNENIVVLATSEGRNAVRVATPSGPYTHAHARATGKALLAFTSEKRRNSYLERHPLEVLTERTVRTREELENQLSLTVERGYAQEIDEYQIGVSCIAVPVFYDGLAVAVLSVSMATMRSEDNRDVILKKLRSIISEYEANPKA